MSAAQSQPQQRPRSKSTFSFRSNKSSKSNGSDPKVDLTENAKEKQQRRLTTSKADPRLAMSEAEPSAIALGQSNHIGSIRAIQHKDGSGNIIAEPDRSNPTRSRWERPLDTIRSFEAAIDGSSSNRKSYVRTGFNNGNNIARFPQEGGYNGHRAAPSRPDSFVDNYGSLAQHNQPRAGRFNQRMNSEPALNSYNNSHGVYPSHGYQQSQDTVNTGVSNGSHGTDPWGNSTDPSSENSSLDRIQQLGKPDTGELSGFNGFGGAPHFQDPILEEYDHGQPGYGGPQPMSSGGEAQAYQYGSTPPSVPPHVPPKQGVPRTLIKLGSSSNNPTESSVYTPTRPEVGEKRKSWFKKRFSKG
ncbi:MAG: hypothetical protein M1827_004657 [Pycnora praestabilis]|nr:MAG: hypothetical protein M1827_004657 [Pycnora praestabilis]